MVRLRHILGALLLVGCPSVVPPSGYAQIESTVDPDVLIRKAVDIQIANDQQTPFVRYRYQKTSEHGVFLKDVIDTREGEVSRLIAINGQPLAGDRAQQEARRLEDLRKDPSSEARHRKHQHDDQEHIARLMRELPDAFHFALVGSEDLPTGPVWHFRFEPNPAFVPPDHESQMFKGMAGEVWIDKNQLHFIRLKAHLHQDIDFGWGLLAVFRKGGSVEMTNSDVGQGHWEITHLKLDVDGTALMLKKLSFHIVEDLSNFEPVSPDLSYQQAVSILQKEPTYTAAQPQFTPAAAASGAR